MAKLLTDLLASSGSCSELFFQSEDIQSERSLKNTTKAAIHYRAALLLSVTQ